MHIYEKKTIDLVEPICKEANVNLVEVKWEKEYNTYFLRVIIDKEGGINVDDATAVSEALSPLLDREDYIKEEYMLEVSSPGIERELKSEKDLVDSIGKFVHIGLYAKKDGFKEIEGDLIKVEDDLITIEALIKGRKKEYTFNKKEISLIRLAVKF